MADEKVKGFTVTINLKEDLDLYHEIDQASAAYDVSSASLVRRLVATYKGNIAPSYVASLATVAKKVQ